jgi:hypothetical protein
MMLHIPGKTLVTIEFFWVIWGGESVSEKVHTQMELSSVSGNPFPSDHELLVFQLKFMTTWAWKFTHKWSWTEKPLLLFSFPVIIYVWARFTAKPASGCRLTVKSYVLSQS